ncbi:MAG: hypothetical protein F6K39_41755 [Okeania sp. SIO3B3]|nr:hypothetical protein [Okeania sp. SIO3B3]
MFVIRFVVGFIVGMVASVAVVLLVAPESGDTLRARIQAWLNDMKKVMDAAAAAKRAEMAQELARLQGEA